MCVKKVAYGGVLLVLAKIPWESVAECQYRSAEEARERGASRVHPKNSAKAESLASNRAEGTGANEDGGAGDVSGGDNAPRPPRRSSQWRRSIRDNHVLNVPPSAPIDCRVHAGFFNMYKTLRHAVMRGLKEHLAKFPKTAKITITGHSLGGVFSSFLALDMLESGLVQDMNRVHVSLYGSPCAGNLAFKKYYDSVLPATLQFGSCEFAASDGLSLPELGTDRFVPLFGSPSLP